jgi:hypothetical protein
MMCKGCGRVSDNELCRACFVERVAGDVLRRKAREMYDEYYEMKGALEYYERRLSRIDDEIEDLVVEKDNIEDAWEDAEERRDEV